MDINIKINKVKEILKNKKIALAFSAGADSTLLAYLAKEAGADVLAITYNNQIFPSGFLEFAKRRASEIGIRHEIIEGNFLDVDEFVENSPRRCLLCRNLMYDAIKQKAHEEGYEIIIDGNNITDLTHDRPGILMKYKYEIESPFIEAELETYEIHQFLEDNHIEFSKATTCLATRVKTNEIVTIDKVNRIDYCESFIKEKTNCDVVKLRENNNVACKSYSLIDPTLPPIGPIILSPNPATNQVNVEFQLQDGISGATLLLTNMMGVTVYSTQLSNGETSHNINLQNIPPGRYLVHIVKSTEHSSSKQLIIE